MGQGSKNKASVDSRENESDEQTENCEDIVKVQIASGNWLRPVVQLSLDDNQPLGYYPSATQAAKDCNRSSSGIYNTCVGKQNQTGDTKWRFAEVSDMEEL